MSKKTLPIEDAIFDYMKTQNRPYSVGDIFSNLHKEYGKTAVTKTVEVLSQRGKLLEKVYGKTKIYVVHQSQFPVVQKDELTKHDDEIKQLNEEVVSLQTENQKRSSLLNQLNSSVTTADAMEQVKKLGEEVKKMQNHLNSLKSMSGSIDPTQKKKTLEQHKTFVGQWRKRKRMTSDLMNAVLEGYPKSKKLFLEEVGIETDEICGVTVFKA
uniref:Homologous-pairing protein 2 homolog n=1 Tax=Ciona savignyi TaxID=51511 RepID=H2ZD74_CIOSA